MRRVPVVFSVDVEPHGFQLSGEWARRTTGFAETVALVERTRPALHDATGAAPSFGWYFRMDPQIERVFGRADHLVRTSDDIDALRARGDHFGAHTHPLRWSDSRGEWVHDIADPSWTVECIQTALEAFRGALGAPCVRHRVGAALCTQEIIDALERGGVSVECGLEPLPSDRISPPVSALDSTELVGGVADDGRVAPRNPYNPSSGDHLRSGRPRGLTVVPMTSTRLSPSRPGWQTWGWWVTARRRRPPVRVTHPWLDLPASDYWDWLARHLRTMRHPYANIAVRTDDPDSAAFRRTVALIEALPSHPIASRIALVDPIAVVAELLGRPHPSAARQPA